MEEVRDSRARVARTMVDGSRLALVVLREALLVSVCAVGAALFLNHQILYLEDLTLNPVPLEAWAISTAVIFAFVRGISFVASIRVPRVSGDAWQCPECGQWIEDDPPRRARSRDDRHAIAPLPRPRLVTTAALSRPLVRADAAVSRLPGEVENSRAEITVTRAPEPTTPEPAFDERPAGVRSPSTSESRTGRL